MMLKNPMLYTPENVERARYAQIALALIAAAVSGYLAFTTFSAVRAVCGAQKMLAKSRLEAANLSRQVSALARQEARQPARTNGGVDVFALQLSRWAAEQGVKIEAVTPQGTPTANTVTVGNSDLGMWNSVKVRVEGRGDFPRVMSLLGRLRHPGMPVQLDSFAFQSGAAGEDDTIIFDLMLTVYQRGSGTG